MYEQNFNRYNDTHNFFNYRFGMDIISSPSLAANKNSLNSKHRDSKNDCIDCDLATNIISDREETESDEISR